MTAPNDMGYQPAHAPGTAVAQLAVAEGADANKENSTGSQLQVQAVWHEQVCQSRISFLAVSGDGETLFIGCEAAAPKLVEAFDTPAAIVDAQGGKVQQAYADGKTPHNVRLLLSTNSDQLACVNDQGDIVRLLPWDGAAEEGNAPADEDEAQQDSSALARETEHAAGQEEQAQGIPRTALEVEQVAPAPAAGGDSSSVPEFLAETGYRGAREGYLFRVGTKGLGYYRKDVVRIYAPMRDPVVPPQEPTHAAAAATAAPASQPAGVAGQAGAAKPAQGSASSEEQPQPPAVSAAASRAYLQRLLHAPPSMQCVITSHDGTLLITSSHGSKDCHIRVWRLRPGAAEAGGAAADTDGAPAAAQGPVLFRTLSGHTASVLSLALNPEGTLLFSGSHDHTIRVWRTSDWSCERVLKGHGGGVRALAVSPDGGMLYSAAGDNTLRVWSTRLWVCLRTLHGRHEPTTWPCCMALSPDGELLASGSSGLFGGSTIKVFQTRSWQGREAGTCLATFAQLGFHTKGAVSAVAFSPDGRFLYTGASDGTLAKWRLDWVEPAPAGRGKGFRKGFF